VFLQKAESGPQPAAINELDYGEKFFQFVLQGCSRKHKCIATLQLLDGSRGGRCPITNSLCLIEDDQVGLQLLKVLDVLENEFVAGEIEKLRGGVLSLPLGNQAFDDLGVAR